MDSSLVNKLMGCARAVADGDLKRADFLFGEMEVLTAAETDEVTTKVVNCFAEALARRVHGVHPRNPLPLIPSSDTDNYSVYEFFPLYRFADMATSYFMLEALITGRSKPLHLIDISMVVGSRYWNGWMFHYAGCYGCFRLTSIRPKLTKHDGHFQDTCQLITPIAHKHGIDFQCEEQFANTAAEIVEAVLNLKRTSDEETIIVRWVFELHKLLALEGAIERVLSKLRDLRPDIMAIVELEANHNSSDFFNRFTLSFEYYYSAFEASEQYDTSTKLQWQMHLRRQISNVVASEGIDRVERHEPLVSWRERLYQAGFHPVQLCSNELKNDFFLKFSGFRIEENDGSPLLCFFSHPLVFVSVWKPVNPTQFNDVDRGEIANSNSMLRNVDLNYPITVQDTGASSPIETEAPGSSDSDCDKGRDANTMKRERIWSREEVQKYLVSSLTEEESKRINRWMCREMIGNIAGRNKRLNVRDTSLANLLRIPPPYIPIKEEKTYYIDDSVMNAYFELLRRRWEKFPNLYVKNYSLPTWIMSFLLSGKWSETKVLSCVKIEEMVGTLKLFIPVCLKDHWILICVDMEKQTFLWLDSLNSPFDAYITERTTISEWVINHLLPVSGYHNLQEWKFRDPVDIPYQTNRVDCGIFVMKYADCLAHGDHFPFTQEDIPHFRYRVFLDIYRGRLSVPTSALNSNWLFQDDGETVWNFADGKLPENRFVIYEDNIPDHHWLKLSCRNESTEDLW